MHRGAVGHRQRKTFASAIENDSAEALAVRSFDPELIGRDDAHRSIIAYDEDACPTRAGPGGLRKDARRDDAQSY